MRLFKTAYCAELTDSLRTGTGLAAYTHDEFDLPPEKTIEAIINLGDKVPQLDVQDDVLAAIALHKFMGELTELEASDKRLWTTLTHTTFRKYVMERWPSRSENPETRKSSIMRRWFAEGGSDRTLENNAIARLWWGAHLTFAPWRANPDEFGHLKREDEYYFTKLLFSLQELIKVTMESSLGRSSKVLIALLVYLDKHPDLINNEDVGALMKELNLVAGANKILVLSEKELEELIEKTADTLFETRTSTYAQA